MPPVQFSLATQGARDYRELAKKLRKTARKDLRAKLRQRITDAGRPVLEEVKDTVRHLPIEGSHGGGMKQRRLYAVGRASTERAKKSAARRGAGLRETIASATRLQITARGVRFVVNSGRLPESQRSLPRHLDSQKGWRHPLFGNKEKWYHQQGKPYFASTIKKRAPQFRQAILKAIDEIKAELER